MGRFIDLTGKKFGKLTVIKRVEDHILPSGGHIIMWLCECDCGNICIVDGAHLRSGNTKSCGCLKTKIGALLSPINKKENIYDLNSRDYGIGYTNKGEEFYFDKEDFSKIKDYCWHINQDGYVIARDCNSKKAIKMHRLIMDCLDCNVLIDHKHGKHTKNDNRKANLRTCTSSQNGMNRGLFSNNTSGRTGVSYNAKRRKWQAYITVNRQRYRLGAFENFEDAVKAREDAEKKYFGDFSYDNSQKLLNNTKLI